MDYASLIAEFGANYGLDDLVPDENGAVGFEADGRPVVFQKLPDSDCVIAWVELCAASETGEDSVNRLLMQANQTLFVEDGLVIVRPEKSGQYCLLDRFCVASMDFHDFDRQVSRLLTRADRWSLFLERYIPVAAEAAAEGGSVALAGLDTPGDMLRV